LRAGPLAVALLAVASLPVSAPAWSAGPHQVAENTAALSSSNPRAGRVFVFSGADGTLLRTLIAPDVIQGGRFGETVAGIGDVDNDGISDLAVGASGVTDAGLKHAGRVYLFSGADGTLIRSISSPDPVKGGRFGFSIASAGDLDADGRGDLVVGAPRARTPGKGRTGAAYLISGGDGSELALLSPPTPRKGSLMGLSVAEARDVTGDNVADFLVGAPGEQVGGRKRAGSVQIFDAAGGFVAGIPNPFPLSSARFGISVATMDDSSGDQIADIVIGADGEDFTPGDFAGEVFLFSAAMGSPAFLKGAFSPTFQSFANYGFSVAGLPDLNNDGSGDFAASAPDESIASVASVGRAYVQGGGAMTPIISNLDDPDPHQAGFFGGAIATLADLTGDGLPEMAVGSELHRDPNGVRAGRAYVVEAKSGALVFTIESPTGDSCARFGWSVAPAGDVDDDGVQDIIVGAPYHRVTPIVSRKSCF